MLTSLRARKPLSDFRGPRLRWASMILTGAMARAQSIRPQAMPPEVSLGNSGAGVAAANDHLDSKTIERAFTNQLLRRHTEFNVFSTRNLLGDGSEGPLLERTAFHGSRRVSQSK